MAPLLSTITAKSQTTLPSGVRKALGVEPGDKLAYRIEGDRAIITKAPSEGDTRDATLGAFLDLLARDLERRPDRVRGLPDALVARIRRAVAGVDVDLDEPIHGAVTLSR